MLESALNPASRSPSPQPITHVEEQRKLRDETIAIFHGAVGGSTSKTYDDNGDDDDDLLVLREKTKDELEIEEEEYREFLKREVGDDLANLVTVEDDMIIENDPVSDIKAKKKRRKVKDGGETGKGESKPETDQEFLMKFVLLHSSVVRATQCVYLGSYILNRGWIDHSAQRVPTYREITDSRGDVTQDTEDEDFEEIADRFESSYNFRFEEPYVIHANNLYTPKLEISRDAAVIKTYPRILPSLVRREDTTRKEGRERRKQRKEEELSKRKEEVRRMKGLKMKELRVKLERIGREGGKNVDETNGFYCGLTPALGNLMLVQQPFKN